MNLRSLAALSLAATVSACALIAGIDENYRGPGGGSGGADGCSPASGCSSCSGCFELCFCQQNDVATCTAACPSGTGGTPGTGGTSGTGGGGMSGTGGGGTSGTGGGGTSGTGGGGTSGTGGGGTGTGGTGGGGATAPPSCAVAGQGRTNCGSGSNESCCTSLPVTGGTFYRGYIESPVTSGYTTKDYPATVANFRLDKYQVTVGRFRKFVEAVVNQGWRPSAGAGKHTYLNSGLGLANSGTAGGNEPGWDASWSSKLATAASDWNANLACSSDYQTWTPSAGANENRPINCASWYELYAFCIWDGGFLPSEAEWHYAASGGSEQRKYPWGSPEPGANPSLAIYGCYYSGSGSCTGVANIAPVGSAPSGAGRWGQQDLAGNVWEWALDWYATYSSTCNNCANTKPESSARVVRGGDFYNDASGLISPGRVYYYYPSYRGYDLGGRCVRTP